ncbi:hypothetical protein PF005_g17033 [Phytophthora fragariae]|uniref:Uncharacterized protein n=2 Tax=Phytophthora fragariae TaxID=53985 RepID=A0A6A3SB78_9STRA|nr:hypothetical protein PF003_g16449 [Phytophthora fragariae]KAE8941200.1 hypothetical protein PF009_g9008 [Phytophthora fragariae]KAE8985986.1 hypothetical protein PF011_g20171 [Phytophthora fragariae]KAE9103843.1 hypothetical protein PF006_g22065 [Phytophthora fragariae]KAE9113540.1 hypothetical protein PF007_g10707 [Phytophthora fragariae]
MLELTTDPSKVPLPKTPETKRAANSEKFRSTCGTPYFEDSHMQASKKDRPSSGRFDHRYDTSDIAGLGDDDFYNRGNHEESVKYQIRRLIYDDDERDDTKYLFGCGQQEEVEVGLSRFSKSFS